jgi:predicted transcriptional regulator
MNKAAQLSKMLEQVDVSKGLETIEDWTDSSLFFDVIDDAMCIMHKDGSVNIIEHMGGGNVAVEVISSENILKVLHHYRPFKEVFKGKIQ